MLGFNDPSGSFCVVSQRNGRREIEDIIEEMKGRDTMGERILNESEETEEIKTFTCCKDNRHCPAVSLYQLDAPVT